MTKTEIDRAFLSQHDALTERFYQAKRAGQITPALQTLFDRAHGYLSLVHTRNLILNGVVSDYFVDQNRTKLRSQELNEALTSAYKLTTSDLASIKTSWGITLA